MPQPPQTFLARLRELKSPFTTEQAEALFPDLAPGSVRVYLSHATGAGLVEQVGFKQFRHAKRPGEAPPLPRLTSKVVARLRSELMPSAFEQLVLWDDGALAPFVHDAFPEPFVVVEGNKRAVSAAERVLAPSFSVEAVRGKQSLGERLWGAPESGRRPQVFLVETARLHATRPSAHGFQVPTVGRLLVTVLQVPALFPEALLRMMESPDFRVQHAIDAAPSKRVAAGLGAFLAWTLSRHPDHPVRSQAERLFPRALEA